jgi:hypothetical protein
MKHAPRSPELVGSPSQALDTPLHDSNGYGFASPDERPQSVMDQETMVAASHGVNLFDSLVFGSPSEPTRGLECRGS